jgi:hypothetical protein
MVLASSMGWSAGLRVAVATVAVVIALPLWWLGARLVVRAYGLPPGRERLPLALLTLLVMGAAAVASLVALMAIADQTLEGSAGDQFRPA